MIDGILAQQGANPIYIALAELGALECFALCGLFIYRIWKPRK